MISLTELETLLITCLPALTSIISIIAAVSTVLKNLNKLKDNESLKAERDAIAEQNKVLLIEMQKQRKQISLLIEKATKIAYKDMTEVRDDEELQV